MEETGQTVQETPKVQAEQTGENGKNVGMPECETMELIMESRSENEEFARVVAAVFASRLDPTLEELDDIKTAVSEAVTNSIVHAYPDAIGKVSMRMRILDGNVLEISIRDWGRGIENLEQAMKPLFTTGGEERSGMGFTIMDSFMDKLRVRSSPGKGTTVTMQRAVRPRIGRR